VRTNVNVRSLFVVPLLLLSSVASTATATVLVPLPDDAMVALADAVVTGIVERVDATMTDEGGVETVATVRVADVLKGRPDGSIVVRQPGGVVGDVSVTVLGTAPMAPDDLVLVFGRRARGGGYRLVGMALGLYRLAVDATGTPVATRSFGDSRPLGPLVGRVAMLSGITARPLAVDPAVRTDEFTLLGAPPASRWFDFDRGGTVAIRSANGAAEIGRARSDTVVQRAVGAWTGVQNATVRLALGSDAPVGPSIAGGVCDGRSVVQFDDPADELDDLPGCSGVLAVGGFCSRATAIGPGGDTFRVIAEGDVTVNRRVAACYGETGVAEVLTHELGHVLGLGHSSENASEPDFRLRDATMFFLAHLDGRGAAVREDDEVGIRFLYPADDDGDGIPSEFDRCPDTPHGHVIDATGCACVDAGHEPCTGGDTCTNARCDPKTAACVLEPVDCTGGEPCLSGTCTLDGGCMTEPVVGYDAIACGLERAFTPAACAADRIPHRFRDLVRRARRLVARAWRASPARQNARLGRAATMLTRALGRLERAVDPNRRRPLSTACADQLRVLVQDARLRIESHGTAMSFVPTPAT
jgi:hypothetical protein